MGPCYPNPIIVVGSDKPSKFSNSPNINVWTRETLPRSGSNIGKWRFSGPKISLRLGVEKTKGFCRNYSRRNSWEWLQFPSDLVGRRGCPYMPCNGLLALHTANSQYAMMETMHTNNVRHKLIQWTLFTVSDRCSKCESPDIKIPPSNICLMHDNALVMLFGRNGYYNLLIFSSDKLIQH